MATVDQYLSNSSLTTAKANIQVSPQEAANNGAAGVKSTVKAVETFADVMSNIVDFQETTQAQNIANGKLKDIQLRAAAESDPKVYDSYLQEIDKAGKEASSTITNGMARMKFDAEHQSQADQVKFTVQKSFWDKQLKAAHADTMKYVEDKKAEYWSQPVDALKKKSMDDMFAKIDALQQSQAIDAEQAMKWKLDIENDLPYGQAVQDANTDPERTKALLQQGYYNIKDPVKLKTAMSYADSQAKKIEQEAKEQMTAVQDQTETQMFLQIANPDPQQQQITPVDVENAFKAGNITPEGARRLTLAINKPVVKTGDVNVYYDYLDQVHGGKVADRDTARAFRDKIIEDDSLTPKQKARLIEGKLMDTDSGKVSVAEIAAQPEAQQGFLGTAWNYIKSVFQNKGHAIDAMDQLQDMMKSGQVSKEQLIEAAKSISAQKAIKVNPHITTAKKGGQLMADRYGNKAVVYPDGNYEMLDNTPQDEEANDPNADDQGGME